MHPSMVISKKLPQFSASLREYYKNAEFFASLAFIIISYVSAIQFLGHTILAFNRFTLIWFPLKHKQIWKHLCLFILLLLGAPFIHVGIRFNEPGAFLIISDSNISVGLKNKEALTTFLLISAIIYVSTTFIAAILHILSFSKFYFHKQTSSGINVNEKNLLFVSLIVFIAQLIRCSYNINRTLFPSNAELAAFFIEALPYFSDIFALSGSISLFILSQTVREQYKQFYFFRSRVSSLQKVSVISAPRRISTNISQISTGIR
uniref:Serpentine receptor class gamma n=1 Tax=Panagrolaimus davidi TaxID=227884 RepID=A0A914QQS0_9BILA